MTTVLLPLDEYDVTDTGEVIVSYDALMKRLRAGKSIAGLCTAPHDDIAEFNRRRDHRNPPVRIVKVDDIPGEFPSRLYDWKIPSPWRNLDLDQYLSEKLVERELDTVYVDRVATELQMMRDRGMEDFLRLMIYIIDTFALKNVVHGIGRGSACASLVLFLIGVHLVDPIEYDIPISEFLR
jgi:hypothetical protein